MMDSSPHLDLGANRRAALSGLAIPITLAFVFFGMGSVQPFVVPYLRDRHPEVTLFQARMVIATIYLVFAPCRLVAGVVMRRLSRKLMIVLGVLGYMGFVAALRYGESYAAFLAGAVTIALGAGLIWTASSAQVLDQAARDRYGAASGLLYLFVKSGAALGVVTLGALVHEGTDYTIFLRTSMQLGAVALLSALLIPSHRQGVGTSPDRKRLAMPTFAFARAFLAKDANWIIPLILCVSFASWTQRRHMRSILTAG